MGVEQAGAQGARGSGTGRRCSGAHYSSQHTVKAGRRPVATGTAEAHGDRPCAVIQARLFHLVLFILPIGLAGISVELSAASSFGAGHWAGSGWRPKQTLIMLNEAVEGDERG